MTWLLGSWQRAGWKNSPVSGFWAGPQEAGGGGASSGDGASWGGSQLRRGRWVRPSRWCWHQAVAAG